MKKIFSILLGTIFSLSMAKVAYAQGNCNVSRILGNNRFQTSANICKKFSNGNLKNVIIANGNSFPDALAGSILSEKLSAPILLIDNRVQGSVEAINYIKDNLSKDGTIYILGGNKIVKDEFVSYFASIGYKNTKRIGGKDRFETNKNIVDNMQVQKGTPVVIVNGYGFADALSISSVASIKGYPILMSENNNIPETIKDKIKSIEPSKVFLIGGEGALKNTIDKDIKQVLPQINYENIIRIKGNDRYETSLNICKYFGNEIDGNSAVIASGSSFPDALSGSALACKLNGPIILTDGSNIISQKKYIDSKGFSSVILLGGDGAVSEGAENVLKEQEQLFYINRIYMKNGKKNIDGCFERRSSDINEALKYEKLKGVSIVDKDKDGYYIPNDGFDMEISKGVTLEVDDNVSIIKITFDYGKIVEVPKDFNELMHGYMENKPIFKISIKNGLVTKMHQQYRP